jgi:hypothetical protein
MLNPKSYAKKSATIVVSSLCLILLISGSCLAQTIDQKFILLNKPNGPKEYRITLFVPQTLLEYYQSQDHQLYNKYDLSKFVTPSAFELVSDELRKIYSNDEDFANGVLMIVHQIPYVFSGPQKYPVESLSENVGDCDLFCFIAASILKAGGIDVALLLYEQEEHMTLGINLQQEPSNVRTDVSFLMSEGKKYYVGECTGSFRGGYRVGECSDNIQNAQAKLIAIENTESSSPDKVSCSIGLPDPSDISMSRDLVLVLGQQDCRITGFLSPKLANKNVTLYASSFTSSFAELATVSSDSTGRFTYEWDSAPGGIYTIVAAWSGDSTYASSESSTSQVVILPFYWLLIGAIMICFLIIIAIMSLTHKKRKTQNLEHD